MKIDRATEDRRFFMVAFHLRQDERLARSHRLPHRLVLDSLLYEELIIVDDFWGGSSRSMLPWRARPPHR
jgi:hypothetical protein